MGCRWCYVCRSSTRPGVGEMHSDPGFRVFAPGFRVSYTKRFFKNGEMMKATWLSLFGFCIVLGATSCRANDVSEEYVEWRTARSPVTQVPASDAVVGYLLRKAELGDAAAMADLSVHYGAAGDDTKHEYWLRRRVAAGEGVAMSELAGYLASKGDAHCPEAESLLGQSLAVCRDAERCDMLEAELSELERSCKKRALGPLSDAP